MPAAGNKIICKCGKEPYILSSRKRLYNLGLRPLQCSGCGRLLPPYIPETTGIMRVSTDGRTIAQAIGELTGQAKTEDREPAPSESTTNLREPIRILGINFSQMFAGIGR